MLPGLHGSPVGGDPLQGEAAGHQLLPEYSPPGDLQSVTFSYGLENIYRYAFEYFTALKSVYLPTSLTTLSEAAFDHTGITSLIIPYGVTDCFGVNSDSIQEISVPSTADFSASTTSKNCLVYCAAGSSGKGLPDLQCQL